MKIAVTGASGHIGNNVCRELLSRGHAVTALVHNDDLALRDLKIAVVKGDVSDVDSLDILMHDADAVCHLAAIISITGNQGGRVNDINVGGTTNVIDSALRNGVKRMFHVSSIHAHKTPGVDGVMNEQSPYADLSDFAYDQSKAAGEQLVLAAREKGLATTIFNPTGVVGPHDYKPGLSGQLVVRLCKGKIPMLTPLGFDWVDVRDVAWAVAEAIDRSVENNKFMISGAWCSVKDFAEIVAKHSGKKAPKFIAPFWLARVGVPFLNAYSKVLNKDPLYTYESLEVIEQGCKNVSSANAQKILGYQPRAIETTLSDTVNWFKTNHYL
jgi:dihydroflavonol-4-reductase